MQHVRCRSTLKLVLDRARAVPEHNKHGGVVQGRRRAEPRGRPGRGAVQTRADRGPHAHHVPFEAEETA